MKLDSRRNARCQRELLVLRSRRDDPHCICKDHIEVDQFEGLLVNYVQEKKAKVVLRGLRTVADYEYELQMSFSNKNLYPELETIFMMTESRFSHISSTIIKEIAYFGGSISNMVHPLVEKKIQTKLRNQK